MTTLNRAASNPSINSGLAGGGPMNANRREYLRSIAQSGLVTLFLLTGLPGCRPGGPGDPSVPEKSATSAEDMASARKLFVTQLRVREAAPQNYQNQRPPLGVEQV